jgi:hypothetical protein
LYCDGGTNKESDHSDQYDQQILDNFPAETTEVFAIGWEGNKVEQRREYQGDCTAREGPDESDHQVEMWNSSRKYNC